MGEDQVIAKCTREGWVFSCQGKVVGPYWTPALPIVEVAEKLGTTPKKVYESILESYKAPLSLNELSEILEITVKKDHAPKLITFLGMLLAQTEEDQVNIAFQSESSTGKSYIPLELIEYFPESERRIYGGASPTAFFHEVGVWDEERKVIKVDLEKKILVFLDQPHWQLIEKLRPLLSHDCRTLVFKITDKREKRGLLTKTVEITGYSTIIFCTARATTEDQERTRFWLLSPETTEEKIREGLNLIAVKEADRNSFKKWIDEHPQRRWLKTRISLIRMSGIRNIVIPNSEQLLNKFIDRRASLRPRDLRDFPRVLRLVKGLALLGAFQRARADEATIIADDTDIQEALRLYGEVAEAQEVGLPPATWEIYKRVVEPTALSTSGVTRREILVAYRKVFFRPLSPERLTREILPSLESAGLVYQEPDPLDRRIMRIYLTTQNMEEKRDD